MPNFVGFKNRDSGQQEWIDVDHIYRVMGCPEPDNLGYALIWLDMDDLEHKPIAILADMDVDEFMKELNRKIYNGSNERKSTRRNHGQDRDR